MVRFEQQNPVLKTTPEFNGPLSQQLKQTGLEIILIRPNQEM